MVYISHKMAISSSSNESILCSNASLLVMEERQTRPVGPGMSWIRVTVRLVDSSGVNGCMLQCDPALATSFYLFLCSHPSADPAVQRKVLLLRRA